MHTVALDANRLCKHRVRADRVCGWSRLLFAVTRGWSSLNWRHDAHVSRNVGATVRSVYRNNFNHLTLLERSLIGRGNVRWANMSKVTMLNLIVSESSEFPTHHLCAGMCWGRERERTRGSNRPPNNIAFASVLPMSRAGRDGRKCGKCYLFELTIHQKQKRWSPSCVNQELRCHTPKSVKVPCVPQSRERLSLVRLRHRTNKFRRGVQCRFI